jgi:hypothetical protein
VQSLARQVSLQTVNAAPAVKSAASAPLAIPNATVINPIAAGMPKNVAFAIDAARTTAAVAASNPVAVTIEPNAMSSLVLQDMSPLPFQRVIRRGVS